MSMITDEWQKNPTHIPFPKKHPRNSMTPKLEEEYTFCPI